MLKGSYSFICPIRFADVCFLHEAFKKKVNVFVSIFSLFSVPSAFAFFFKKQNKTTTKINFGKTVTIDIYQSLGSSF